MKISISGKGGSGKTTTAGTLARLFAQGGNPVLAIDGDSNPNLGMTLGLPLEALNEVPALPSDLLMDVTDDDGNTKTVLRLSVEDIATEFGTATNNGVQLLAMKKIDHAGAG
ncbi:nucleotide-binding protein [Candidatus Entotheonella palauensis]|uniref:nucleotide-binding protein n=1 Tax=Candidatus Entotheonella palauensis TaxID=93172 RepID=UPI000B7EDA3D|nr:AAA family ATPase [Candidatus Entotheonella palauensis]